MFDCTITVVKKCFHKDLSDKYENPISHACDLEEGQTFTSINAQIPDGFCPEAWSSVGPIVKRLAGGEYDLYDGWMQNKRSAVISCNDGIRPVSFYIEAREK